VLFGNFDILYVYRGLRPSSIIPALLAKYVVKTKIFEEWWEWYSMEGIGKTRKGMSGKLIAFYDTYFELKVKFLYTGVVCINKCLYSRIKEHENAVVLRGASEQDTIKMYPREYARKKLNLDNSKLIIGLSNFDSSDINDNLPFIKAFEKLNDSAKMLLVTGSESHTINHYLTNAIYKAMGWIDFEQYNYFLSACDIFILPYPNSKRNQGRWPNKIGDFVVSKRKIITNPTAEVYEFLKEYQGVGLMMKNEESAYFTFLSELDHDSITQIDEALFEKAASSISYENRIEALELLFSNSLTLRT